MENLIISIITALFSIWIFYGTYKDRKLIKQYQAEIKRRDELNKITIENLHTQSGLKKLESSLNEHFQTFFKEDKIKPQIIILSNPELIQKIQEIENNSERDISNQAQYILKKYISNEK